MYRKMLFSVVIQHHLPSITGCSVLWKAIGVFYNQNWDTSERGLMTILKGLSVLIILIIRWDVGYITLIFAQYTNDHSKR